MCSRRRCAASIRAVAPRTATRSSSTRGEKYWPNSATSRALRWLTSTSGGLPKCAACCRRSSTTGRSPDQPPDARASIRLRHSQHFLCDKAEYQVRADRCDARNERLAQITLDVELLRISHAAHCHHGGFARLEPHFARVIFRGIRFRAARLACVVE